MTRPRPKPAFIMSAAGIPIYFGPLRGETSQRPALVYTSIADGVEAAEDGQTLVYYGLTIRSPLDPADLRAGTGPDVDAELKKVGDFVEGLRADGLDVGEVFENTQVVDYATGELVSLWRIPVYEPREPRSSFHGLTTSTRPM